MNGYELLSELFGLLARVDDAALKEAREACGSPRIRAVVDALRSARRVRDEPPGLATTSGSDHVSRSTEPARFSPTIERPGFPTTETQPDRSTGMTGAEVSDAATPEDGNGAHAAAEIAGIERLLRSARIPNVRLVHDLRRAGIRVAPREKESRERLVGRVQKAIAQLPISEQRAAIRELRRQMGIDETGGWIDVIRSGRKE